jgi:starch-binding outer membrane protein, SusD/RagB family
MKYFKKPIEFIIILTMIFTCNACIDLEEDISSLLTLERLETESDVLAALAPVYRRMSNVYSSPHLQRTPTYGADDITTWWAGNKAPLRVFDRFDYGSGENSDIVWLPHGWTGYWKVIYYANSLIEGLKTSTAPAEVISSADGRSKVLQGPCLLSPGKDMGRNANYS